MNNITTRFLLRPLGLMKITENVQESILGKLDFKQAYIGDIKNEEDYNRPIYLLFGSKNMLGLQNFIEDQQAMKATPEKGVLVADYDYPGYTVLVYEFPEKFRVDYDKITWGQYSKTSQGFKDLFPVMDPKTGDIHPVFHILNRTGDKKRELEELYNIELEEDSELESIMNFDNSSDKQPMEQLDITKYVTV